MNNAQDTRSTTRNHDSNRCTILLPQATSQQITPMHHDQVEPSLRPACRGRARPGASLRRCLVLSVHSGHRADYLTGAVAVGRENYYTGAVAAGEPSGRWFGKGAEALGLHGEVDAQDMTALYERFIDPRDDAFRDPARWDEAE